MMAAPRLHAPGALAVPVCTACDRAGPAATVNRGTVNVGFSSTSDPNVRFISINLKARTIATVRDGEMLFKNGFEFGVGQCLAD